MKKQKTELMKMNTMRAREELISNKFQRPTAINGAIDKPEYIREMKKMLNSVAQEMGSHRSKGVLQKNNQTA